MAKTKLDVCPNCGEKMKGGLLSKRVYFFAEEQTKVINKYFKKEATSYCNICGDSLWLQLSSEINSEINNLRLALDERINTVPILTTHTPLNWDYDSLGIVTGQSVTGTGVFAEIASSITDFVGAQSGIYSDKLAKGETLCFYQLRKKTVSLGGNAVIAADIDFSEAGGLKGMLMVCMAGTAVRLKNPSILGNSKAKNLEEITSIYKRLDYLESFGIPEDTEA